VKIELNRDWTEFLSALISRRVRFVIVGGHAVAGHGEPRLTEDLDVFVERSVVNARRIRQALVDFGFGNVAPTELELGRLIKCSCLAASRGASTSSPASTASRSSKHGRVA
jgi:hypothetical protein